MTKQHGANHHLAKLILFSFVLLTWFSTPLWSSPPCASNRPNDRIWMVSTRCLGGMVTSNPADIGLQSRDADGHWQVAELAQLTELNSADPIVIYVHGNRVDRCEAIREGLNAYRALTSDECEADVPPLQFVIWSWPSNRIRGPLRDVRYKARRTDLEGYYLALWLSAFDTGHRVALIGHSFGARIVAGGLHMLGGGQLAARVLPNNKTGRLVKARVVLLAAALHNYWLQPGCRLGLARTRVDQLLNLYNRCDPVLRHYPVLDRCARAEAAGYTGLVLDQLDDAAGAVEQHDVACWVGANHGPECYFSSPTVLAFIRAGVLGDTGISKSPPEVRSAD